MKLLIIQYADSDLSEQLSSCCEAEKISFSEIENKDLNSHDSIAVLGGKQDIPVIFEAPARIKLEAFADTGKPLFLEYVNSFRCVYSAQKAERTHHRLVAVADVGDIKRLTLLDSHCNSYIRPYFMMPDTKVLLEYHAYVASHSVAKEEQIKEGGEAAFWQNRNILQCAFRLCDYAKARFAPKDKWQSLVEFICNFLTGKKPEVLPDYPVRYGNRNEKECVDYALSWLERFIVKNGKGGILEGLSHNILPDGTQMRANNRRTDCAGEAAGAFLFSGKEKYREIAENLFDFVFDKMMIRGGDFDGMLRWTEEAWEVCYQDDMARAMIPALLAAKFGITDRYLDGCTKALDFLVRSTAKNGLRKARTDNLEYIRENKSIEVLADEDSGYASAHYNSWYSAALLLCGSLTGNRKFIDTGIKGLESLMALYPDTVREHSETSELCRLIFPLSVLFETTKEEKHREMLYRVYKDLETKKHKSGSYAEWDTDYKATCSKAVGGECSLLADNGDPVCDLLYSVNWLPLGFSYAFYVTGDRTFADRFYEISRFFAQSQAESEDLLLDGSWGRGWDMDIGENVGVPHDVGWGPCAVESGWTVSEIAMGIELGEKLISGKQAGK